MADADTTAKVAAHALVAVDKFTDSLTLLAQKLAATAQAHAPQVWEIAKQVARVSALGQLLDGLVYIAVGIVGWRVARWAFAHVDWDRGDLPDVVWFFLGAGALCAVLVGAIQAAAYLVDPWPWVGVFQPTGCALGLAVAVWPEFAKKPDSGWEMFGLSLEEMQTMFACLSYPRPPGKVTPQAVARRIEAYLARHKNAV
jgi:hypothetical protein